MMAVRDTETEREREKAAAVLELMSACQIRNTMHLRQNKKKEGGEGSGVDVQTDFWHILRVTRTLTTYHT